MLVVAWPMVYCFDTADGWMLPARGLRVTRASTWRLTVVVPRQVGRGLPAVPLAPGLWQVAGPGVTHEWDAVGYLVMGRQALLIDPGSGLGADRLDASLAACGITTNDLLAVVATHGHYDHVGDGARLVAAGLPVLVHAGDADAVRTGDAERTCAGPLYGETFAPFVPEDLVDGDRIDLGGAAVEVVHTPGHTPGSTSLVVHLGRRLVLLAGDTLWGGFSASVGSDEAAWRESLARLAELDLDALSFGHGPSQLLDDPGARIAEARARFASYYDPWFRPPRLQLRY